MFLLPWTAVQYVTSGLTLAAFLSIVILAIYRRRLLSREILIQSVPEKDRPDLVKSTLETFFAVDTRLLTSEQAYKLALEQIRASSRRYAISAGLVAVLGILAFLAWLLPILRADSNHSPKPSAVATLTLSFEGTTDVFRQHLEAEDPNLVHNTATLNLETKAPRFFKTAGSGCDPNVNEPGCRYVSGTGPARISADGLKATAVITATGDHVRVFLTANEWEHLSKDNCGLGRTVAVVPGQTTTFISPVECLSIAKIKLTRSNDSSEETFDFGQESPSVERLGDVSTLPRSSVSSVNYRFIK